MPKNILIFSDGTSQKGGIGANTNVYKLFNMAENRTDNQIVYYDPGLGTDWKKITGSLFGRGFSENILDCYRFIFENFEAHDKIYLFGFSRGAATVRSLATFIHLFGILPKSRPDLIKQAFSIYKKKDPIKQAELFIEKHHTMWCSIEFIGVWDTVLALGIPVKWLSLVLDRFFPHQFHSLELSPSVKTACHALAIDDERKIFHPSLWQTDKNNDQKIKQVWFSGVHTDVGGGYQEHDLSDIALKWMIREAVDKGLLIYKHSRKYKDLMASDSDVNGIMHNEQKGFIGSLFKKKTRTWDYASQGRICIHDSVLKRVKNPDNLDNPKYAPWILKNSDTHKPFIES